jgi:fructose-bisphosphate aldolase class II
MPLVTMKEILKDSVAQRYAVGAFDTMDPLFTEGILMAAENKGVPVILMVVEWSFDHQNCNHFFSYLVNRCRMSSIPVALHLDHGSSFEAVMKAIHYGCTSVMLDGSLLPLEKNIVLTKKVVEVAHACGVTVEAEIGHVAGHEGNMFDGNEADESAYTTLKEATYFTEKTNIDALAIAIGTVHGVFKGIPKLDYDRLDEIRSHLNIPLVLHGGSGLTPDMYRKVIAHGINKINFFTGMTLAASNAVRKFFEEYPGNIPFEKITNIALETIREIVETHIEIFGTKILT